MFPVPAHHIIFIHGGGVKTHAKTHARRESMIRDFAGAGISVMLPAMPHPERPLYREWRDTLTALLPENGARATLIGHSLGGSFLLKYLTECDAAAAAIASVHAVAAPFWQEAGSWGAPQWRLNPSHLPYSETAPPVFLYHSPQDDVVPYDHMARFARALPGAKTADLPENGHDILRPGFACVAENAARYFPPSEIPV